MVDWGGGWERCSGWRASWFINRRRPDGGPGCKALPDASRRIERAPSGFLHISVCWFPFILFLQTCTPVSLVLHAHHQYPQAFSLSYSPTFTMPMLASLWVEKQASQPSALLRLPPHVRHRIYLHADVARLDRHPYTYYLGGENTMGWRPSDESHPRQAPRDAVTGLLLTCRTLYAEVAALLYSANRFVVYYTHDLALAPLRALSPTALAAMTNLKIVLIENSCHRPTESHLYPRNCCWESCRSWGHRRCDCQYEHDTRWKHGAQLVDPQYHDHTDAARMTAQSIMLAEWHDTAAYMAAYVRPDRLDLSLVCELDPRVQDLPVAAVRAAARLAVAPLGLFPRLRDCHVRLRRKRDRVILKIAQDAALQARFGTPPRRPASLSASPRHSFMSLPTELRHRILEQTDLITPWRRVVWRQGTFYLDRLYRPESGSDHDARLLGCDVTPEELEDPDRRHPGCFCSRRHAAFSSACRCWVPPADLFLVSRMFSRDAQFIFFSRNRFVIKDYVQSSPMAEWALTRPPGSAPVSSRPGGRDFARSLDRFAISDFLRAAVPAQCLGDLRDLELVVPAEMPLGWPTCNQHYIALELALTVRMARPWIGTPAIALQITIDDRNHTDEAVNPSPPSHVGWARDALRRIIWPLGPMLRDGVDGVRLVLQRHDSDTERLVREDEWLPDGTIAPKRHDETEQQWRRQQEFEQLYEGPDPEWGPHY